MDHKCKNLSRRSYLQHRRGLNTVEQLLTCVTKNVKKLVRDRRIAASSITDEERVDQVEETQGNTKCDFQIERS